MNIQHEQFDTTRLNAIPITEVARHLGETVRKSGVNHFTLCPWHDDHSPSLSFDERTGKNYCHCFACGKVPFDGKRRMLGWQTGGREVLLVSSFSKLFSLFSP